jgi:hypothetical protein
MGFARPALSSYTTCWDTTSNQMADKAHLLGEPSARSKVEHRPTLREFGGQRKKTGKERVAAIEHALLTSLVSGKPGTAGRSRR